MSAAAVRVEGSPFCVIERATASTGLVVFVGRRYVYIICHDRGIRVANFDREEFNQRFRPLYHHVDGAEDPTKPYDIHTAARRYLDWGNSAGITNVAADTLRVVLQDKEPDMSHVETQVASQTEPALPVPSTKEVKAALAKAKKNGAAAKAKKEAVPKNSTKNSTSPEAKRPSKATKTVAPGKETANAKAMRATREQLTKDDNKKASKATKSEKPGKKAAASKDGARGRPSNIDGTKTIKVEVEDNPRREGSGGHDNWLIIKKYNGKTVEAYLKAGGNANHLRWDISHKNVKLV
jgi:hypothetical protein